MPPDAQVTSTVAPEKTLMLKASSPLISHADAIASPAVAFGLSRALGMLSRTPEAKSLTRDSSMLTTKVPQSSDCGAREGDDECESEGNDESEDQEHRDGKGGDT